MNSQSTVDFQSKVLLGAYSSGLRHCMTSEILKSQDYNAGMPRVANQAYSAGIKQDKL